MAASPAGVVRSKSLHLTSYCRFCGALMELVCLFVRVFAGRELASGSLWQVAGQSCGAFLRVSFACVCVRVRVCVPVCVCVCVCVLVKQRGQPCNPMRAPTHRTNKVEVCVAHPENTDQCESTC